MTRRRLLLVVATAMATLITLLAGAPTATPAVRATDPGQLGVSVTLGSVTPAALTPDSVLEVTGTVRNTGRTTLSSLQVILRLDWRTLTDRRQLAEWAGLAADHPANGTKQASQPLGRPLAPGESAAFSVSVAGDVLQLPLSADGFGPRGMAVEIQDGPATGGRRVGIVRSFAVWNPVPREHTTRLALLVPVGQGRQPVDPRGKGEQVPQLWEASGRLARLLTATGDPAFSYALDPALLTAAARDASPQPGRPRGAPYAASGPSTTPPVTASTPPSQTAPGPVPAGPAAAPVTTPAPVPTTAATRPPDNPFDPAVAAAARTRAAQLKAALPGREVLTLPYADPDVAALGSGFRDVLDVADDEAALVTKESLGAPLVGGLVWASTGRIDTSTAGLAAGVPGRTLIIPSSAAAAAEPGGTAPVHARMTLPNGTAETLFTDDALSAALAATGGADSALAAQRLLAETAAISAAHPDESPVVLATVPRDWNPDPAGVLTSLPALKAAPWLTLERVSTARNQPAVSLARARLATPTASPTSSLPLGHVRIVARQLQLLHDFSTAIPDRADQRFLLGPIRRSALEMLSTSWIARQRGVGPARGILTTEVGGIYQGVTVVAGSSANLLARSGQLPITVDNHLPVRVTVLLHLHATSGRVVVRTPIPVDLQASRSRTVPAELQAVANGEVRIESSLSTPGQDGVPVSSVQSITVRVNYDWETRGLRWVVGALLVLLVAGLVRSVRRGRVRLSPDSVPDPDDVGRDPEPSLPRGLFEPATDAAPPVPPDVPVGPTATAPAATAPAATAPTAAAPTAAASVTRGGLALAARTATRTATVTAKDTPTDPTGPTGPTDPTGPTGPTDGAGDADAGGAGTPGPADEAPTDDDPPADDDPPGDNPRAAAGAAPGDTGSRLVSNSAVMAAGTLVSRVLGVVRTVVLAWAIGLQSLSADAFTTANTIPNSLMILIAGGALNAVLVPQIVRAAKRPDGGKDYLDRLLTLAILVLGGATVLATLLAPVLVRIYAADNWSPAQVELATAFAVWCLPQIFFYGLYTIYGQVLNARGSFGPYMWAPVVNNVVAIGGTLIFVLVCGSGSKTPQWWSAGPIALLAGTATLGIVAQALVLLPAMHRSGYRWRPRWGWRGIGLRTAGQVAGWTFAAAAVGQLGFTFVSRAANQAGALGAAEGAAVSGRAVYDNAYLLFILPHSLVAVSLVTATFTRMSISASAGRTDEVRADASLAVRLTGVATVLATVAIVVLGPVLTRVIFLGNSRADTDALALATSAMALGLVPFSAMYLFSRVFYAYEDARTPFWIQVATVTLWAAGSTLAAATLPPEWIVPGIGLAMSASNLVGAAASLAVLRRRLGGLDGATLLRTHVRLLVAALVAGGAGWLVGVAVDSVTGDGRAGALAELAVAGGTMIAVYLAGLRAMRVTELDLLVTPLARRLRRDR